MRTGLKLEGLGFMEGAVGAYEAGVVEAGLAHGLDVTFPKA